MKRQKKSKRKALRRKAKDVKRLSRMLYLRDNANDGRFRSKVVKNKRKDAMRRACRGKRQFDQ